MKQISLFLAVVTLFSCRSSSSKKEFQKIDTVLAVINYDGGARLDSVIRLTGVTRSFPDSTTLSGSYLPYTLFRLHLTTDTLTHHFLYSPQPIDTIYNSQIHIIPAFPPKPPQPKAK